MKILHVGKFYSPIEGGIETINKIVVNSLKGNSNRIVSFNNKRASIEEDIEGVPVVRASSFGMLLSQPLSWSYYKEIKRYIKSFQPQIIHFHYPNPLGAIILLILNRKDYKLIVHWHSDIVSQKFLKPFIRPIEKKFLKRADAIIATSPGYVTASELLSVFKTKVTIIPCSIEEKKLGIDKTELNLIESIKNTYGRKPIILFVGRHVEYKGLRFLLEAEKLIKSECEIIIGGSGPLTNILQKEYNSSRLHWIGKIPEKDLKYYYHAADIYAFPSITRNEAFGISLAEAMYCNCPAVTFNIRGSGVNWVSINHVTGLEVENRNVAKYAEAIDKLIQNDNLRIKYGKNAKKRVEDIFLTSVVEKLYQNLYISLIE